MSGAMKRQIAITTASRPLRRTPYRRPFQIKSMDIMDHPIPTIMPPARSPRCTEFSAQGRSRALAKGRLPLDRVTTARPSGYGQFSSLAGDCRGPLQKLARLKPRLGLAADQKPGLHLALALDRDPPPGDTLEIILQQPVCRFPDVHLARD